MNVSEAKSQILDSLQSQLTNDQFLSVVNPLSPQPPDEGKFSILGRPARAIHRFDGWHLPINTAWFRGSADEPRIRNGAFYWYAIAIPKYSGFTKPHYVICDYMQIRDWVLDFHAPLGVDRREQRYWRADIELYRHATPESIGYLRWGDEPAGIHDKPSRVLALDNINEILEVGDSGAPGRRIPIEVSRIVRDTGVTRRLKTLYGNRCQICGTVIGLPGHEYSEAHHLKPLGRPHNGPDVTSNVVILCPNHHAEFDRGYVAIEPHTLRVVHLDPNNEFKNSQVHLEVGHDLAQEFLIYHYENIFGKQTARDPANGKGGSA